MKNVLFDMETGDPDDLITLLLLLVNPEVNLRGITCYQGSTLQIGLIQHVLELGGRSDVLLGGAGGAEPSEISPYYQSVVGDWRHQTPKMNAVEVFKSVLGQYPDTHVLTGAPLTNVGDFLVDVDQNNLAIQHMTTQGGYLGPQLVAKPLDKFKNRASIRTYNLSNDTVAFDRVNSSAKIHELTFVTKDLCHGFMYTPEFHQTIEFGDSALHQLLKSCLSHYGDHEKSKAMHDPLAMIYMLHPELGQAQSIAMSYTRNQKNHALFSSVKVDDMNEFNHHTLSTNHRHGLVDYDATECWKKFSELCSGLSYKKKLKI